jgi:hypothetical protein
MSLPSDQRKEHPLPFMRKWSRIPDNYDEIYYRALDEIQQPDSFSTGRLVTVWGTTK